MSKEAMKLALEALEANRRTHYYCEDTWYSCPKHEDGCANEAEGDDCNCGADSANAEIEKAITALRESIANEALDHMAENARELGLDYEPAQQQEPVATLWQHGETGRTRITMPGDITDCDARWFKAADLYTSPPAQRTWVGLTDEEFESIEKATLNVHGIPKYFGTAIEAKLKEKNNGLA